MASTSETGHARNVANFEDLIAFVISYGLTYNPTKNSLKLPQLHALYAAALASLTDVTAKKTTYNFAVNQRMAAFDGLKKMSTRLIAALEATDASPYTIADAEGFNRKIQGKRAAAPEGGNSISVSQRSYDSLIEHFAGLIAVLAAEPSYMPNEEDLKITTLNARKADMIAKNSAVATAFAGINNARISRNNNLYALNVGILDIAASVKDYVKSVYGASSPEFALIKGLKFVNYSV
ncbi:MAG TPA: hypothetical protein VF581_08805 [Flavobacterium sp.]|jgi:hypothetical protein